MLIQEILNSYNPDKVREIKTSDTRFYRKVVLETGDTLLFDADTTANELTSGEHIWEIAFRVNGSYAVGTGDGKAVNEVFSYVLQFLDELKNNGAKAFYFTADKDHQKLYNALVKRFARGMNVETLGDYYQQYFITTDDFELGFTTHRNDDAVIISVPNPFAIDFERNGAVIEVSGGTHVLLQTLNDKFPNTIGAIGNLLTQDSNQSRYIIQGGYNASEISVMLDIDVFEEPTIITTYLSKNTGSWVYEYFDGEELRDETADSNDEGLWELYFGDVPESLYAELVGKFINEVNPRIAFVYNCYAPIESPARYEAINTSEETIIFKSGVELPVFVERRGNKITARLDLGLLSFKLVVEKNDEGTVIAFGSYYDADDDYMEELLRYGDKVLTSELIDEIKSMIENVNGGVMFDTSELDAPFIDALRQEIDFVN